jgi:Zn-dependent protease
VSLAGPSANVALAVLLLVSVRMFFDPGRAVFWAGVAFLGFLQVTAVVLNLLPIPGLDGYGALEPHLSPQTQRSLEPAKQFAFLLLLLVLIAPPLNEWFFDVVYWFFELSGVPPALSGIGSQLTRFWSAFVS